MDNLNNLFDEYVEDEDTQYSQYLTFVVDEQLYGISISDVEQISGMREITYVPEFPEYAKGVVNLRGNIIPIIDIRLRLKKEEIVGNGRKCIIITKINDSNLGFIVDSVSDVLNINNDDISNPKIGSDYVNTYITGMAKLNDKIILLMDLNKIINLEELIVDHAVNKDVKEG